MIIELLVKGEEKIKEISDTQLPEGIAFSSEVISSHENAIYLARFNLDGNSINAAKELAAFRDRITDDNCVLITDEASQRFERDLYEKICIFERGIRKLLHLRTSSASGDLNDPLVKDIESKDFGELFEILFSDESFIKKVRSFVKDRKFDKAFILQEIENCEEKNKWGELFGAESAPTIVNRHNDIRIYRNDVMHSHQMSYQGYQDAKKLLDSAINEIKIETQKVLKQTDSSNESFYLALSKLMDVFNSESMRELSNKIVASYDSIVNSSMFQHFVRSLLEYYEDSDESNSSNQQ